MTKFGDPQPKLESSTTCVILIIRKVVDKPDSTIPLIFTLVLKAFHIVPKEFQDKPPPICGTQPEIESDSEEFTYHPDIDFGEDLDDDFIDDQVNEELSGDIVEFSTLISSEVTSVITEIIDVFSKDNTPISSEVTTIAELVDIFLHDLTRNISQIHLTHLHIVTTIFSQKRYKNCRVIVDNRSCTNVVFFEVFENDGLKLLPHSHPFKIPWLKFTTIGVS